MLFSSFKFITVFLPIVLLIYFLTNKIYSGKKISIIVLLISSIIFYGYSSINHLCVLILSIFINFLIGNKLLNIKDKKNSAAPRNLLALGILFNLALLFLYKYLNFFSSNLFFIGLNIPKSELILPIGISFYTFQQIGYLIDSRTGKATKSNIFEYAAFVSFFPQLIAGPIVHHSQFINQFKNIKFNPFNNLYISNGILIFIVAFFKKVIIADTISRKIVEPYYENIANGNLASAITTWISTSFYSLQLYFDFSAYSEMAIGLGLLFGITLPINFNSPFQAKSLIDFWSRWNITLTNFINEYLYLPILKKLSQNSKNLFNNHIYSLIISMTIAGFWHTGSWKLIIWGFINGLALALNHLFKAQKININLNSITSRIIFLIFTNTSFIIFKANDLNNLKLVLLSLIPFKSTFNNFGLIVDSINMHFLVLPILLLLLIIVLFLPSSLSIIGYGLSEKKQIKVSSFFTKYNLNILQIFIVSSIATLMFLVSISQIHQGQEFIYFQF